MRNLYFFAGLLIALMSAHHALADQIQMLPPVQFPYVLDTNGTPKPCTEESGMNKFLTWDGSRAILCVQNLVVTDDGNVGIGTTTPTMPLQLGSQFGIFPGSSTYNSGHIVFNATPTGTGWEMLESGYPTEIALTNTRPDFIPGSIAFFTGPYMTKGTTFDGTILTAKMTISNDGDVGIGTTTPQAKLQVAGTIKGSGNQIFGVSAATMQTYHSGCTLSVGADYSTQTGNNVFMHCVSACNRYCTAQGWSGGTLVEWSDDNASANCACIP